MRRCIMVLLGHHYQQVYHLPEGGAVLILTNNRLNDSVVSSLASNY